MLLFSWIYLEHFLFFFSFALAPKPGQNLFSSLVPAGKNVSLKSALWLIAYGRSHQFSSGSLPVKFTSLQTLTPLKNGAFLIYLFTVWRQRRDETKAGGKDSGDEK